MYSKEDIERKRQEALERQRQKRLPSNSANPTSVFQKNIDKSYPNQNAKPSLKNNNFKNCISNDGSNKVTFNSSMKSFSYGNPQKKMPSSYKQQSILNRFSPINNNKFYGNQPACEVNCSIISSNRFAADTSIFHQPVIEILKTIPTRLYDAKSKVWNFHINDYDLLHEKLVNMKPDVVFNGLPSFVLKVFKNSFQNENKEKPIVDLSRIDATLLNSLYQFQREGIEYGVLQNGRCLIADDMGLGKTRQALGLAHYYKNDWPLIIVTPSSVRYQWSEAIIENLSSVPAQSIQHIVSTKDYIEKSQITIISYDLLGKRIDEIAARKFGVIICDESHYLKSPKTQRTKSVQKLANYAQRIILLTGTPALSRPIELHSQMKLLMPSFINYYEYGARYCAGVQTKFGWDFSGSSNLKELENLLKTCCMIRRLKSEVMNQLPSKIRQKIILDKDLIKSTTKEMQAASKTYEKEKGLNSHIALLEYYRETSKAKEKAVCNYITELLENEEKFLVFAHHQSMMDAISQVLTAKKILFIRIDGKTNAEQRKYFVDTFQQNEDVLVAVLSITAANAGITMTAARLVLFAELYWNPGILCQAEDRVHRIGQIDNVVIRYLLAQGTADDYLWPKIQKKIETLNEVGLDQNFDLKKAEISNQLVHNQQKMDNFIMSSPPNAMSTDAAQNSSLQTSSDSLKDLLDLDDAAFDDIDLDNIV
ncbi:SWI/SNF-related matrix-associated actin-dependent regulator of chromatin subfamily A-like protein 1 [Phymastichus coffea]|uniref:SWI/SNF-related matrix-associated actin-dependent regulator of chromatin subfamily A-like protein 1 n=1 Tax=Phymastichus coffea TaxID=108790 RepID=UPI00273BF0E4|nr:SWI/SNF-related matrix-associated actin-dependent regulator of chromatin subfamily A-like protein 1 [Phymastichus coffea]